MQETSLMAYEKVRANGNKERDQEIILWVLKKYGKLTAFGIAKRAYYTKMVGGFKRKYKLDYVAVNRRMSELRNAGLIELVGRKVDTDGSTRNEYMAL